MFMHYGTRHKIFKSCLSTREYQFFRLARFLRHRQFQKPVLPRLDFLFSRFLRPNNLRTSSSNGLQIDFAKVFPMYLKSCLILSALKINPLLEFTKPKSMTPASSIFILLTETFLFCCRLFSCRGSWFLRFITDSCTGLFRFFLGFTEIK